MKFKKTLSLILSVTIILCSFSTVFATENLIDDKYICYGDLTEGENKIWTYSWQEDAVHNLFVYYTFTMTEDGYFYLHYGTPHTSMTATVQNENDYYETVFQDYRTSRIYKLEKGDYKLIVDVIYSCVDVEIQTGCLEGEITDISFDYDMIDEIDFERWHDNQFECYADSTFNFSSGKTYSFTDGTLFGTIDSEFKNGKNDITVYFLGSQIKSTATVYPISHYIEDAELINAEEYFNKTIEYFEYADFYHPTHGIIYITHTNGTQETITTNELIRLANGQEYPVDLDYFYDKYFSNFGKGNCELSITIGSEPIKTYYFNGTKASFAENLNVLTEEIKFWGKYSLNELKAVFENPNDPEETMLHLEYVYSYLLYCFSLLFDFCFYYSTFAFLRI
ncbi:MAG: hypothetical protein IKJ41_03835 [Clostridia bacterium]|nr:hypothetical protein [Clostridia bacterium]